MIRRGNVTHERGLRNMTLGKRVLRRRCAKRAGQVGFEKRAGQVGFEKRAGQVGFEKRTGQGEVCETRRLGFEKRVRVC